MNVDVEIDGQYRALREGAGVVDRSERGKLALEGPDAAEYLHSQITNDVTGLAPGEGCYAALLDHKGHMRGDMRVLRIGDEELWIDTEPVALPAIRSHLDMYRIGRQVELRETTGERAIFSVIGPASGEVIGAGPGGDEHSHREIDLGGVRCRSVTADLGYDLIVDATDVDAIRGALERAGAVAVAEEAADVRRIESGRPRYGAEMTGATIPQEAGINERAVSFTKGCYIGQETVARLYYKGKPNRHLRGLRLSAPASAGESLHLGEREVGAIGTAAISPALGPIALAIVRREAEPGAIVTVGDEGATAEVVEVPFEL